MNRQEMLRTAESLRENEEVLSAIVVEEWGTHDRECLQIEASILSWDIQRFVRDGGVLDTRPKQNEEGNLEFLLHL